MSATPTYARAEAPGRPLDRAASAARRAWRGFGGRFAVVLSGELVQSVFHFVLNIVLVRTLSAYDYGLFAMVFTAGAVGIAYVRATAAVPATLKIAHSLGRPAARGYDVLFGSVAVMTTLALGALATAALWPVIGPLSLTGGAFVCLYTLRSYLRIVLLAHKAPRIAGGSDAIYSALGIGFALMILLGPPEWARLDHAFLALAVAHAAGIAASLLLFGKPVRLTLRPQLWRRYFALRRNIAWSLMGVTSITLQGQGLTLVFAVLAGPAAYAPIAATLVLFAILRIPTNALTNMVLPEITGLLAAGRKHLARRLVIRSTVLIAIACLFYGAAMWVLLPSIECHLFKNRFAGAPMHWIGLGVWVVVTISLLYAIPRAFLEASAAFRTIALGALGSAVLGFAIMIPMLMLLPSAFALAGLATSELAVAVSSALAFRARAGRAERAA